MPGEVTITSLADPKVVERGREVARSGAVSDLVRRDDRLTAAVAGSEDEPYRVTVRLTDRGVTEFRMLGNSSPGACARPVILTSRST